MCDSPRLICIYSIIQLTLLFKPCGPPPHTIFGLLPGMWSTHARINSARVPNAQSHTRHTCLLASAPTYPYSRVHVRVYAHSHVRVCVFHTHAGVRHTYTYVRAHAYAYMYTYAYGLLTHNLGKAQRYLYVQQKCLSLIFKFIRTILTVVELLLLIGCVIICVVNSSVSVRYERER